MIRGLTGHVAGEKVAAATRGQFDVTAVSTAIAAGALVYWTGAQATGSASGNDPLGRAVAAKANGATTLRVELNGTGPSA